MSTAVPLSRFARQLALRQPFTPLTDDAMARRVVADLRRQHKLEKSR